MSVKFRGWSLVGSARPTLGVCVCLPLKWLNGFIGRQMYWHSPSKRAGGDVTCTLESDTENRLAPDTRIVQFTKKQRFRRMCAEFPLLSSSPSTDQAVRSIVAGVALPLMQLTWQQLNFRLFSAFLLLPLAEETDVTGSCLN